MITKVIILVTVTAIALCLTDILIRAIDALEMIP